MLHDSIASRPSYIEINLAALESNFRRISALVAPVPVMAIVKSNAYGHGLLECAAFLERDCGAGYLGVAYVEEGLALRKHGIRIPILVLGGIVGTQIQLFIENDLDIVASSVSKLQSIEEEAKRIGKRARVQLKIDTGLERIGVHYYSAESLLEKAATCQHCDLSGIFTHFVSQDNNHTLTKLQLERFHEVCEFFNKCSLPMPTRHAAGSGGLLTLAEARLDMVRPGCALYGVLPDPSLRGAIDLDPVMSIKSEVVYFKVVKKGAGVSYDHAWTAPYDTRVVTVPVGYGDGLFRPLSNNGEVLIRGKRYPIIGKVCMDQFMVDIGPDGEAFNGDEVVIIGSQGNERISLEDMCGRFEDKNPRVFMVAANTRLPRRLKV
jgi:alanine racemase